MDPICKAEGCYMFAPDSEFRGGCEKRCRLKHPPPRPSRAAVVGMSILAVMGMAADPEPCKHCGRLVLAGRCCAAAGGEE